GLVEDGLAVMADRGNPRRCDPGARRDAERARGEMLTESDVEAAELRERDLRPIDQVDHAFPELRRIRQRLRGEHAEVRVVDLAEHGVDAVDARAGDEADIELSHRRPRLLEVVSVDR